MVIPDATQHPLMIMNKMQRRDVFHFDVFSKLVQCRHNFQQAKPEIRFHYKEEVDKITQK